FDDGIKVHHRIKAEQGDGKPTSPVVLPVATASVATKTGQDWNNIVREIERSKRLAVLTGQETIGLQPGVFDRDLCFAGAERSQHAGTRDFGDFTIQSETGLTGQIQLL